MTGRELQAAIVEAAHAFGWRAVFFRPARTTRGWRTAVGADGAGWPDLTLVRDRVVFAEIKGDGDRLRPEQREWHDALRRAGAEVHVWTSREWMSGAIDELLKLSAVSHREAFGG